MVDFSKLKFREYKPIRCGTSKTYAGIGSRQTPQHILDEMEALAMILANEGYILHSGGAAGADSAFERGVSIVGGEKKIFLPWKGFNGNRSPYFEQPEEASKLAAQTHPAWDRLSNGARKLMARNSMQILGENVKSPVDFVICYDNWTLLRGGTKQAVYIANLNRIPVFNLYDAKYWTSERVLNMVFGREEYEQ